MATANEKPCANCKLRAKYDESPKSVIGRIWRWHINFCPGWKGFMNSLDEGECEAMRQKYNLKK